MPLLLNCHWKNTNTRKDICLIIFALKTTLLLYKFKISVLTTAIPNPCYFLLWLEFKFEFKYVRFNVKA